MRGKTPQTGKAKTTARAKRPSGRTYVPKSVSCDPQFLKVASRRASELGYPFSGYIRCLIAHDLAHHVVDPDAFAAFRRRTQTQTQKVKKKEPHRPADAPTTAREPQGQ